VFILYIEKNESYFNMPQANIKDVNIRGEDHPKYSSNRVEEDRAIEFIVQKLENLLFTNTGDVLGDPNFGANLEFYLWTTNVPISKIETQIKKQIDEYIPELNTIEYSMDIEIYEGTARDILQLNFRIKDTTINFFIR
jgi:phage baseplate assembly protein W